MLVLTRKIGEEIAIGDDIRIIVNAVSGNRARIGIQAPFDVKIIRGELEPLVHEFDDSDFTLPEISDAKPTSPLPAPTSFRGDAGSSGSFPSPSVR